MMEHGWAAAAAAAAALVLAVSAQASTWPPEVEAALTKAGANRGELERVLENYRAGSDPLKLEAAVFLIANMDGHGYIVHMFRDEQGKEVAFDALDYASYSEARAAFEELEKQHGVLDYGPLRFEPDLERITADFLIDNIDLAFMAWREKPWARDISFETFCELVLPYRGSNEPLEPWRAACLERLAGVTGTLEDPTDIQAAGVAVRTSAQRWVRFSELYYLHPTDQGFVEMLQAGRGRCEDMSNMLGYAFKAHAVLSASDYTPWWADRDNNHAWEVLLDAKGLGKAGLAHRAAKVYRKTFALQRDTLGYLKADDEKVPRWLDLRNYKDVTDQYMDTSDVTVKLNRPRPDEARHAYLCIFNDGEWRAIHWGRVEGDHVTFTKMGRRIAYLPAYSVNEQLVPAAEPFILTREGELRVLDGASAAEFRLSIAPKSSEVQPMSPAMTVKQGGDYELFVADPEWRSLGHVHVDGVPVAIDGVPAGRLYWLVRDGSRRLERIFTIENGVPVHW